METETQVVLTRFYLRCSVWTERKHMAIVRHEVLGPHPAQILQTVCASTDNREWEHFSSLYVALVDMVNKIGCKLEGRIPPGLVLRFAVLQTHYSWEHPDTCWPSLFVDIEMVELKSGVLRWRSPYQIVVRRSIGGRVKKLIRAVNHVNCLSLSPNVIVSRVIATYK